MITFLKNTPPGQALRDWVHQTRTRGQYLRMFQYLLGSRELFNLPKWLFIARFIPYTMVYYSRLSDLYDIVRRVEREKIHGAMVECGVWRGGCAALMAVMTRHTDRKTYLFDSFEGLPEPLEIDGPRAIKMAKGQKSGALRSIGTKAYASIEEVATTVYEHFGLEKSKVILHKGWFQHTLPVVRETIGPIAVLRLDADWYESTRVALENLYDNVVPNGYVVIDDYGHFEGCRKATDEFIAERELAVELRFSDYSCIYFRKPDPKTKVLNVSDKGE